MDKTAHIQIDVRVPQRFTPAFLDAITGDDDCLLLAIEKLIQNRVGESYVTENVEVDSLDPEHRDTLDALAHEEKRERVTYGPYVDEADVAGSAS